MLEQHIKELFRRVEPVGSRVTCNPAPTDTDEDYLCLLHGWSIDAMGKNLVANGFTIEGQYTSNFRSFRKGDVNLVVTNSREFFDKFMLATKVSKRLNLLNKRDRIILFAAIRDGEWVGDDNDDEV